MMKKSNATMLPFAFLLLFSSLINCFASANDHEKFVKCLLRYSDNSTAISKLIYTPRNSSYLSVLDFYIQNSRFLSPETPKPKVIVTPDRESQLQTIIYCAQKHKLQLRIRSGGHDFEGSSYISQVPYVVVDMFNFRSISINVKKRTAWIGAGANLGEVYYAVYKKKNTLSFAAGYWPTVAIGGHLSGGGYGALTREYGLASDQVIDARVIDVNGRILDRQAMGEDLFFAIRGAVGASFCIVLSFKVRLVDVTKNVAAFRISRTLEQASTLKLVNDWQYKAPELPLSLTFSLQFSSAISNQTGKQTVLVTFVAVYRGGANELLSLMNQNFPELGLRRQDVMKMLWIQFQPFHLGLPINNIKQYLTSRIPPSKPYFSAKADIVKKPIPQSGISKILNQLNKVPPAIGGMEWTIFKGGAMDTIPTTATPFPYRKYLFIMFEMVNWNGNDTKSVVQSRINWLRGLHRVVGPYVPNNPRPAYVNYRDLDLGVNNVTGPTSVEKARAYGRPYFNENFDRLVGVKTTVDPGDFFRNEQSIPPY